jgi:DNA-directed RNA polymerase I, II, and III subunit RPABC2
LADTGYDDEFDDIGDEFEELSEEELKELIQIGPPILTRFEKARILGTRALQISMGAPVIDSDIMAEGADLSDPLLIATLELEKKLLPISVRRFLPDGRYQDIPINILYLDWSRKSRKRKKKN